jgi:uncharacterized membrane protein YqhA
MIQSFLALRYFMLLASLGATVGAALMFWQGGADLVDAGRSIATPQASKGVAANVMAATDAILFGIVLLVFAYAMAFGLVLDLSPEARERLPAWMRVESLSHLKLSLIEVILVYMIVDVATDWAQSAGSLEWSSLVKPFSIVLIAVAVRLLRRPSELDTKKV